MKIYTKKKSWKVFLLFFASAIVVASLWYTNGFIKKIAQNERNQVELWAKAISRKADLVRHTESLFENLRKKEKQYVYLWTEATKKLVFSGEDDDIDFFTGVISGNQDIPVIVTDEEGNISAFKNLDLEYDGIKVFKPEQAGQFTNYPPIIAPYYEDRCLYIYYRNSNTYYQLKNTLEDFTRSFLDEIVNNSLSTPVVITDSTRARVIAFGGSLDSSQVIDSVALSQTIARMQTSKEPIIVNLPNKGKNYIFYEESPMLTRMRYYPPVLLSVIALFLIISYSFFSTSRKSEQSSVWAGMAKETAHQLGTPISSLMGWLEVMKMKYTDEEAFDEMNKDIDRLKLVSERFSKIGSTPELKEENIVSVVDEVVNYMRLRAPKKIRLSLINDASEEISAKFNKHLIIWVFENLIKNAVDAIGSEKGSIGVSIGRNEKGVVIDVVDSGKGIQKSKHKNVFNPGYSTKTRGWGLGLSLSKRIIEDYHRGKIFVKASAPGQGSTFRIMLKSK